MQQVAHSFDGLNREISSTTSAGGNVFYVTQKSYIGQRLDCSAVRLNNASWGTLPVSACTAQADGSSGPDRISKYGYDAAGRMTQVVAGYGSPTTATEATGYTPNGKTASVTDANGNVTSYTYDGMDRLQATIYPGGSTEVLRYDPNSNIDLRQLRDNNYLVYSYDNLNRLVGVNVPPISTDSSRGYAYDLMGNMTRAFDLSGKNIDFVYDVLGRKTAENSNTLGRSYSYDIAGRRTRLTWSDGFFVTYDYLTTGETSAIRENGGFVLASYAYDNLGRRTGIARGNGTTTGYGYNAGSQLITLTDDLAGTAADLTLSFGYNTAGQINSRAASNNTYAWVSPTNVDRGYSVNGLNQYTQAGGVGFSYDARGNLVNSGGSTYGYTAENRLVSAPGASLDYDPTGRLLKENGQIVLQYDGSNLISEQNTSGSIMRRYVFGPGTDEPIVWYEGSGTGDRRWLIGDERGSVIAVTDGSANSIGINRYDEFGIPAPTNLGRFQYTGQVWLSSLGMYHYKSRAYSPTLGRFMQTDPIGYGDGVNWYSYVGNDPVNKSDPTGLIAGADDIVVIGTLAKLTPIVAVKAASVLIGVVKLFSGLFGGGGGGPSPQQIQARQQQQVRSEQQNRCLAPRGTGGVGAFLAPGAAASEAAAVTAGTGVLGTIGAIASTLLLSGDTPQPSISIFRVVGNAEYAGIKSTNTFQLLPGGGETKQFWLTAADARWYANSVTKAGWEGTVSIVSTNVSERTLSLGENFSDIGHPAVAFRAAPLQSVNSDAARSGIQTLTRC